MLYYSMLYHSIVHYQVGGIHAPRRPRNLTVPGRSISGDLVSLGEFRPSETSPPIHYLANPAYVRSAEKESGRESRVDPSRFVIYGVNAPPPGQKGSPEILLTHDSKSCGFLLHGQGSRKRSVLFTDSGATPMVAHRQLSERKVDRWPTSPPY